MKTTEMFDKKMVLSFEVFPPKLDAPIDTIYKTLDGMKGLEPDFISVTYGASGKNNSSRTFQIASDIKRKYRIESVAHLSCIGLTKEDVAGKLAELRAMNIDNILALRGDIPEGFDGKGDFKYASELIEFIREYGGFNILAACYPEGHIESKSIDDDIHNLKRKVTAGADHLITQLFLDNTYFYAFMEHLASADIRVPVEAGIMPVINTKQIKRMASLCGATIPQKFTTMMDKYGDNPIAMRDAGIAYAINQIVDLIAHGVHGIHLYTMNNAYIANKIYEAVHSLIS